VVRTRLALGLAAGVAAYLLYVVSIGGDFMAGRFMSLPFAGAVLLLARSPLPRREHTIPALVALGAAVLASPQWPLRSDAAAASNIQTRRSGIVDERAVYFPTRSLLHADRRTFMSPDWPVNDGEPRTPYVLDTCGLMGAGGIDWGPYTHLMDECALADPLLARLPAIWNEYWRPGHFRRLVPEGYRDSLRHGANHLKDAGLAAYYNELRAITRGPVWSADRFRRIGRMNRGAFDHLVDWRYYRYSGEVTSLDALADPKPDGTPRGAPGTIEIVTELAIPCEDRPGRRFIDLSVDADDSYRVTFVRDNAVVSFLHIGATPEYRRPPGLITHSLDIPQQARDRGFDTIVIVPGGGDGKHAIGHLLLDGEGATDAILAGRRNAAR
jgi:arabinofuranosyltransferase